MAACRIREVNSVQDRFESAAHRLPGSLSVSRLTSLLADLIADVRSNLHCASLLRLWPIDSSSQPFDFRRAFDSGS
jgi:hypothetical protein